MIEKIRHPKKNYRETKDVHSSCSFRGEHKHWVKEARWEKRKIRK